MKRKAFFLFVILCVSAFPAYAPAYTMDITASDLGGGRISIGYEVTSGPSPMVVSMSVSFSNGAFLEGPDDIVFFDPSLSAESSQIPPLEGTLPKGMPGIGFPMYDIDITYAAITASLPLIIEDLVTLQLHSGDSDMTEVKITENLLRGGIMADGNVPFYVTWPEPFTVTIPEPCTLSLLIPGLFVLRRRTG